MKKGNTYPQVRARWVDSGQFFDRYSAPCFIQAAAQFFFIIDVTHPLDITTVNADPAQARWQYNPSKTGVEWVIPWTDGDFDGVMIFRQVVVPGNPDRGWEVDLNLNYRGTPPFGDTYFFSGTSINGWNVTTGFDTHLTVNGVAISRWVGYTVYLVRLLTYSDCRMLGINPEETSPITWG